MQRSAVNGSEVLSHSRRPRRPFRNWLQIANEFSLSLAWKNPSISPLCPHYFFFVHVYKTKKYKLPFGRKRMGRAVRQMAARARSKLCTGLWLRWTGNCIKCVCVRTSTSSNLFCRKTAYAGMKMSGIAIPYANYESTSMKIGLCLETVERYIRRLLMHTKYKNENTEICERKKLEVERRGTACGGSPQFSFYTFIFLLLARGAELSALPHHVILWASEDFLLLTWTVF